MTPSKQCCFAHNHLTCAEYGLWTLGRELSHKTGVLYFDGRNMAKRFRRGSKNTMYKLMHALIKSGWFVILVPKTRKANGQWSAHALRVLSHEDWTKEHQGTCKTEPENDAQPVPISSTACPKNASQPVLSEGHSIGKDLQSGRKPQSDENLIKNACPENGTGNLVHTENPTNPKKQPKAEALEQHVRAACPSNGTGPVPRMGQDGSVCSVPENPPISPPVAKPVRRTRAQLEGLATITSTTVDALLSSGKFELAV